MATKTFDELKQLAIQIRDEKTNKQNTATRIGTQMLEHLEKLEQDYYDKTTINNRTSEYNVSINHPTSGISGGNKYDLASAIGQVPAELRTAGLTVSFLNESGDTEKWEFSGGSWAVGSFEQVGAGRIGELSLKAQNSCMIISLNNSNIPVIAVNTSEKKIKIRECLQGDVYIVSGVDKINYFSYVSSEKEISFSNEDLSGVNCLCFNYTDNEFCLLGYNNINTKNVGVISVFGKINSLLYTSSIVSYNNIIYYPSYNLSLDNSFILKKSYNEATTEWRAFQVNIKSGETFYAKIDRDSERSVNLLATYKDGTNEIIIDQSAKDKLYTLTAKKDIIYLGFYVVEEVSISLFIYREVFKPIMDSINDASNLSDFTQDKNCYINSLYGNKVLNVDLVNKTINLYDISKGDVYITYSNCVYKEYTSSSSHDIDFSEIDTTGLFALVWNKSENTFAIIDYKKMPLEDDLYIVALFGKSSKVLYINSPDTILINGLSISDENTSYRGLDVSILSDSYSAYGLWIPEGNNPWYANNGIDGDNDDENDVNSVTQMWWYKLINELGMKLLINNSWSGSTICNTGYDGADSTAISFITRMKKSLGEERALETKPSIILILGATNDSWAGSPLGELKYSDWSTDDLKNVLPAICYMFDYIKKWNPGAIIVNIANNGLKQEIIDGFQTAAMHYGVYHLNLVSIDKQSGHPSQLGMEQIKNQVKDFLSRINR